MSHGVKRSSVALAVTGALLVGGVIGFFFPHGSGINTSSDGKNEFACVLARNYDEQFTTSEEWNWSMTQTPYSDLVSISVLLGGATAFDPETTTDEQVLGRDIYQALVRLDTERLDNSMTELLSWCDKEGY